MKKILAVIAICLGIMVLGACSSGNADANKKDSGNNVISSNNGSGETKTSSVKGTDKGDNYVVGCLVYKYDDVYLSTVRQAIQKYCDAQGNITLKMYDGQNDQAKQLDQLDAILSEGVDCLFVNMADQSSAGTVIDLVKDKKIPLVFFNREPIDMSVFDTYDKAIYVGTQPEDAGIMQGDLLVDIWKEKPEYDRNGDGKVQYIVFKGEADNLEAIARSEYCVKQAKEKGLDLISIATEQVCDWNGEKAMNAMQAILAADDSVEAVMCNNDEMATGVVSALQSHGLNMGDGKDSVIVLGVDGTDAAVSAIDSGYMNGTVKQDGDAMGKAVVDIAVNYLSGKEALDGTGYEIDTTGHAIRIPYSAYLNK